MTNASAASGPAGERQRLPLTGRGDAGARGPSCAASAHALVAIEWGSQRDGSNYNVKVDTFPPPGGHARDGRRHGARLPVHGLGRP